MADFKTSLQKTLVHEGGYQNYQHDTGNWYNNINYGTKFGITPRTLLKYHPELLSDVNCIRNLTVDVATEIYQKEFWSDLYNSINDQTVADKLFDIGVLMGVPEAVKLLQIALQEDGVISVVSDGKFGPVTLAQINAHDNLLPRYRTVLLNHAMNVVNNTPSDAEFINDWVRRINS